MGCGLRGRPGSAPTIRSNANWPYKRPTRGSEPTRAGSLVGSSQDSGDTKIHHPPDPGGTPNSLSRIAASRKRNIAQSSMTRTISGAESRGRAEEECPHEWGHGSLKGYATVLRRSAKKLMDRSTKGRVG